MPRPLQMHGCFWAQPQPSFWADGHAFARTMLWLCVCRWLGRYVRHTHVAAGPSASGRSSSLSSLSVGRPTRQHDGSVCTWGLLLASPNKLQWQFEWAAMFVLLSLFFLCVSITGVLRGYMCGWVLGFCALQTPIRGSYAIY